MEARVAAMLQEQLAQQRAALSQEAQAGLAGMQAQMAAEVAALRAVADRQQAEGTGLVTENAALRARITQGTAVLVQKDQELLELQGQLRQVQAGGGVPLPGVHPVRDALLVELRERSRPRSWPTRPRRPPGRPPSSGWPRARPPGGWRARTPTAAPPQRRWPQGRPWGMARTR